MRDERPQGLLEALVRPIVVTLCDIDRPMADGRRDGRRRRLRRPSIATME